MALLILLLQLTQTVPLLLQQVLFLQPQQPQPQPQLPQQPLPPQVLPNKAVFQVIQLLTPILPQLHSLWQQQQILQEVAATAPTTAPPAVTPAASDTKPNNINTIGYGEISDKQMEEYMRSNSNILENTKSDRLKAKDKRKKKKRSKK